MSDRYFLYGSHASYYTAKSRSYLRKKGIPFTERLPSHPRFREYVRPSSENHRIPQLECPDGEVVQDTVAIFDHLEARFPDPPAYPAGPRQQMAVRMLEALVDPLLLGVAWHYRWDFMDENYGFVGREFGRSFRPQGSNEEIDHYGQIIADRMAGFRPAMGEAAPLLPTLEAIYFDVLDILERHFTVHPYLLGGLPSVADHVLMGPLFGHLARDPQPSMLMKQRAPRVFRWTEHMNTPEIQSPEFAEVPLAFLADDEVPGTVQELLRLCVGDAAEALLETNRRFGAWAEAHPDKRSGDLISDEGVDEPALGLFDNVVRGVAMPTPARVYPLWVLQRARDWFESISPADQKSAETMLEDCGGTALLTEPIVRRLTRVGSRLAIG